MPLKNTPIRRKLMAIILVISGSALLLTCAAFFAYEYISFRQTTVRHISTLGAVISSNSTAALAFDNQDDAREILNALKAEPYVVAASLYDRNGRLFSKYPADLPDSALPAIPEAAALRFSSAGLVSFQPIVQGKNRLGTLYLKFDTRALYERFRLYSGIVVLVMVASLLVAYILSRILQRQISEPILSLAETARAISERGDYSVRAKEGGRDELGLLTDAFNRMLTQIHEQDQVRSQFVAIVESSDDAIISKSFEGTITSWNPGAKKIFGYSVEEVIGKRMLMLIPPDRANEEAEILARIRRGESVEQFETVRIRKDGTLVDIAATISPIRETEGGVRGASIVAREITELKRAEAEIQELNQELEQRVARRTAQLENANTELRHAKEVAEAATLAKSRFLATMSHEIRTPINGVIGMTGLLLQTELTAEQRDFAETIAVSGESLLKVINDILDFSKVEAGRVELESITFGLRDCVGGLLRPLAMRADHKHLELVADISPAVPDHLIGDPMRLRQILNNFVDNAIKFTAHGEVVLRVRAEPAAGETVDLHFSIVDTGIGIPANKQKTIFEPFAQVDNTTTRNYGGTGLGLAIATQLIEQMCGRFWVESQSGEGSTFHFAIPFRVSAEAPSGRPESERRALQGSHVLVVDDHATTRAILREMLLHAGLQPTTVNCGAAALSELLRARNAKTPFELILIDAVMPEMDGLGLVEKIRQLPRESARIVMMMLPSVVRPGISARCRDLGVATLLTKPVIEAELFEAITTAITGEAQDVGRSAPEMLPPQTRSDYRILLVEDNAVNKKVALAQLRSLGYTAATASDGFEALEALRHTPFEVVLMDCHMPGMDGYEAAAAIRQREGQNRHTWIIAMTADAMAGDREQCLAAGMDDYLSKPVRATDLTAALERARPNIAHAVVDFSSLDHLRSLREENGENTLHALVGMFRADAPRILGDLREALKRADAASLALAAHSLKGNSGFFGAQRLQELCAQLQEAGKAGDLKSAAGLLTSVELQLHHVLAELKVECEALSS